MTDHLRSFLVLYSLLTDIPSAAVILWLVWEGLKRAGLPKAARLRTWASVSVVVASWYIAFSLLSANGAFQATPSRKIPAIPIAVFAPLLIGSYAAIRSRSIRKAVEALPTSWLVAVQFYRVIGIIFVVLVILGQLPAEFGYPAGLGDIAVGVLAIPTAWLLAGGSTLARPAAYAWNVLGMLDFIVALATGFLSSPSPIQRLAFDHPNVIGSAYPLVMIPTFLVPLSWILHLLCLWRLRRRFAELTGSSHTPKPFRDLSKTAKFPNGDLEQLIDRG